MYIAIGQKKREKAGKEGDGKKGRHRRGGRRRKVRKNTNNNQRGDTGKKRERGKKHVWEERRDKQFGMSTAESGPVETELSE